MAEYKIIHKTHADVALGELSPQSPEYGLYLSDISYVNYEIDFDNILAKKQNCSPYETDFSFLRNGVELMAGIITDAEVNDLENNSLKVAGKEWMHYLQMREYPFVPASPTVFSRVGIDMFTVVTDVLDAALALSDSLAITHTTVGLAGVTINFKIEAGDLEDLYSKFKNLSQQTPGFDMEITPAKEFKLYYPRKGTESAFKFEVGKNVTAPKYSNTGISATHFTGLGAGTATKLAVVLDNATDRVKYRRIDGNKDFGNIANATVLTNLAQGEFDRQRTPIVVFSCHYIPNDDDTDIFAAVKLGDSVKVQGNFVYDQIDGMYRVIGMRCSPTNEGDEDIEILFDDNTLSL